MITAAHAVGVVFCEFLRAVNPLASATLYCGPVLHKPNMPRDLFGGRVLVHERDKDSVGSVLQCVVVQCCGKVIATPCVLIGASVWKLVCEPFQRPAEHPARESAAVALVERVAVRTERRLCPEFVFNASFGIREAGVELVSVDPFTFVPILLPIVLVRTP